MNRTRFGFAIALAGLSACGGDDSDNIDVDASGPDASATADASTVDAAPVTGQCGIEITPALPGVPVIFQDTAGAVLTEKATDAAGIASYDECVEDGMITFLQPMAPGIGGEFSLITFFGVNPTDVVQFNTSGNFVSTPEDFEFTAPTDVGALTAPDSYSLASCEGTFVDIPDLAQATTFSRDLGNCLGETPTNVDFLATARDTNGVRVGYSVAKGVTLGGTPNIATGAAWVPAGSATEVTISPGPILQFESTIFVDSLLGGASFAQDGAGNPGDTVSLNTLPDTIADDYQYGLMGLTSQNNQNLFTWRVDTVQTTADFGNLPSGISSSLSADETGITVNAAGGGIGDAAVFQLHFLFWEDSTKDGSWIIIAPADRTTLPLPDLPDSLLASSPAGDASFALFISGVWEPSWFNYSEMLAMDNVLSDLVGAVFDGDVPCIPAGANLRAAVWTLFGGN